MSFLGASAAGGPTRAFDYSYIANNDLGRRTDFAKTGALYSLYGNDGILDRYAYNDKGDEARQGGDGLACGPALRARNRGRPPGGDPKQLLSAITYVGSDPTQTLPALPGRSYQFGYDNKGNRTSDTANARSTDYTAQNGNQYSYLAAAGSTSYLDVAGADDSAAAVTVNGQAASRQHEYFHANVPGASKAFAGRREQRTFDNDGNPTGDPRWTYVWDGANRLVEMTEGVIANNPNSRQKLLFYYDYLGRRYRKQTMHSVGVTWNLVSDVKYVYATKTPSTSSPSSTP